MINRLKRLQRLNLLQQELLCDGGLYEDIKKITEGVVEILNADFCRIWMKGAGDKCDKGCIHASAKDPEKLCRKREYCLHLIASSGRYTHIDGPHSRMPFGLYKVGRIADGQTSKFLTNDVVNDPQIMDHEWARGLGLVSFAGYKLQDSKGEPIGVLALFSKRAITPEEDAMLEGIAGVTAHVIQTVKAKEALKIERDKLMNIMGSMGDGIYIVNKTHAIEYINPVVEREFGPMRGRKCYEYFHALDRVCPWCKNEEVFAGKTVRWECYFAKNNKTYDMLGTPLYNYDGSISAVEIFRDVTEHKRAEQELALFRTLLDRSNDAIEVVDPETGRFLDMNERGLLDLGYSREELPYIRVWDIDPAVDQSSFFKIIEELRKSGSIVWNSHHQRKDGSKFPVEINIKYIQLDRDYVITVVRDITERRKIEKELVSKSILNEELIKLNKMKSQFLANVSHELRTPLNSILGFSELLIEKSFGGLNEKQMQYINYINQSGNHLLRLINNILDMSKVEAGRVELEPEEFSLADAMDDVLNIIRPMAHKKSVVIDSKPIPLPIKVILDRAKFKQIMLNLISNAVKFNKRSGKVNIDWDISEEAKGDIIEKALRISVQDTGIGIKAEDIPRLFRDFEQLDSSVTREYGGTGIGMALTKKLIELHGGRIWVESEYGKGTTFSFVIPQSALEPRHT